MRRVHARKDIQNRHIQFNSRNKKIIKVVQLVLYIGRKVCFSILYAVAISGVDLVSVVSDSYFGLHSVHTK